MNLSCTSADFFSTQRRMESRRAREENDSSRSTPALVVAAPSKAFVITFWNMTSMSFMPLLKVVL